MRSAISTHDYFVGPTALTKALRDPKVVSLARSMNLNLQDPSTLKDLLKRTKRVIESSTQVVLSGIPALIADVAPVHNVFINNALRVYQKIEGM